MTETNLKNAIQTALSEAPASPSLIDAAGRVSETAVALSVFSRLLASEGLRPALYSLLRRSDYRFVGIFRFKGDKATSAVHVDRENLNDLQAAEVSDTATYCTFARDSALPFVTVDATRDRRTAQHVARDLIKSYCGVPLIDETGEFLGTLCHYDVVPRDPSQIDVDLVAKVAELIVKSNKVPPYPS